MSPPLPQCGQTENITFPHPSDAVDKYTLFICFRYFIKTELTPTQAKTFIAQAVRKSVSPSLGNFEIFYLASFDEWLLIINTPNKKMIGLPHYARSVARFVFSTYLLIYPQERNGVYVVYKPKGRCLAECEFHLCVG